MKPISQHPAAFFCSNGNAVFFDDQGHQITKFQKRGWAGYVMWRRRFPDGDVFFNGMFLTPDAANRIYDDLSATSWTDAAVHRRRMRRLRKSAR